MSVKINISKKLSTLWVDCVCARTEMGVQIRRHGWYPTPSSSTICSTVASRPYPMTAIASKWQQLDAKIMCLSGDVSNCHCILHHNHDQSDICTVLHYNTLCNVLPIGYSPITISTMTTTMIIILRREILMVWGHGVYSLFSYCSTDRPTGRRTFSRIPMALAQSYGVWWYREWDNNLLPTT